MRSLQVVRRREGFHRRFPLLATRSNRNFSNSALLRDETAQQSKEEEDNGLRDCNTENTDLFAKKSDLTALRNAVNFTPSHVQLISDGLYNQIFMGASRTKRYDPAKVQKCRRHLETHGLWNQRVPPAPLVDFKLPELEGSSLDDHFRSIASQQTSVYKKLLDSLCHEIPQMPEEWARKIGWTKYRVGADPVSVDYPEEDAVVFDIETCVPNGHLPVMACAVSPNAWYSWCSQSLISEVNRSPSEKINVSDLIPFETKPNEENILDKNKLREKIVVGHNVSFDRARIKEQYIIDETKLRFMDTMSLHIAVSGITSFQRALKMTMKNGLQALSSDKREELLQAGSLEWNDISSLNNLKDVHKLYCESAEGMHKEIRNVFITGSIKEISKDFQNLMTYCATDVKATQEVLAKLMPMFYERFPSPVTLSGMLEMGIPYLPINSNWTKYIASSEETFSTLEAEMKSVLMKKADDALKLLEDQKYKYDPWLWDLDWKLPRVRKKKAIMKRTKEQDEQEILESVTSNEGLPAWYRKLFYKPSDEGYIPGPAKISTSMQIIPKLLRLCWFGFPLHHSKKGGWGYLVKNALETEEDSLKVSVENSLNTEVYFEASDLLPKFPYEQWEVIWKRNKDRLEERLIAASNSSNTNSTKDVETLESEIKCKSEEAVQDIRDFLKGLDSIYHIGLNDRKGKRAKPKAQTPNDHSPHPKCEFRPLPHKDGAKFRVGNPLAKDFLNKMEDGILTSESGGDIANKLVRLSKMVSYWRNNRDRIIGQMTVWMNSISRQIPECDYGFGAILPQVSVAGTLTRRAVERTWLTASNAYTDRIGSELKGMVQVPPGFHFVGADVDSQELWIASILGDAHFTGIHGSTALGWMTLQGSKSNGTDMHSKTATLVKISRDHAKVMNYGRIYGAGVSFAERLLQQFNPELGSIEAKEKAKTMYKMTKGERKYLLNEQGRCMAEAVPEFFENNDIEKPLTKEQMRVLMKYLGYPPVNYMEFVDKLVWDAGTESEMFNRLEGIAQMECPATPFLNCCISRSLVPSMVQNDFMTSRVNWVVQSSAVDYLHLMLTCMRWLIQKYNIKARFSISVHDEIRYIVKSEDRYRAALALQITNLLTRSMCSYQLGMKDLPQSVAFFSCVDIDKVLRKEVTQDCKTPSNPQGLTKGYNIVEGEALDIFRILDITKGSLE